MSSNRLKYDTCAYATTIKESTEPLEYWLYKGKYETCTTCSNANFTNNIEFSSRADVESELYGLTRPGTDCPSLKYDPTKSFNNPYLSPPIICQSIYGLTPSNLVNPTTNMLNENNLGINLCSIKPNTNVIEKMTNTSCANTQYKDKYDDTCYPLKENGKSCSNDNECKYGRCDTIDTTKSGDMSPSNVKKCTGSISNNKDCTIDDECYSNFCKKYTDNSKSSKCFNKCNTNSYNKKCQDNTGWQSPNGCEYPCKAFLAPGTPCDKNSYNAECRDGLKCNKKNGESNYKCQ